MRNLRARGAELGAVIGAVPGAVLGAVQGDALRAELEALGKANVTELGATL